MLVFVDMYIEAFLSMNFSQFKVKNFDKAYFNPFQVFLGHSGARDIEGNELPRLVYVSREKRPGYQHHKKAGAENALVCEHYLSSSVFH